MSNMEPNSVPQLKYLPSVSPPYRFHLNPQLPTSEQPKSPMPSHHIKIESDNNPSSQSASSVAVVGNFPDPFLEPFLSHSDFFSIGDEFTPFHFPPTMSSVAFGGPVGGDESPTHTWPLIRERSEQRQRRLISQHSSLPENTMTAPSQSNFYQDKEDNPNGSKSLIIASPSSTFLDQTCEAQEYNQMDDLRVMLNARRAIKGKKLHSGTGLSE